ncbi:DUF4326 domain-containing protein [Photobacterium kishitanii]|uniref:DUF4326 domain-containing protein n=1 Tax=Photobacterium kishitanii TaxID=318456 RepID=UPI000432276F|nr:DUF4326 domain-containing protein [Photobacterium kishitanii]CEO39119.1 conserved hypothetical protein [Photobacterium kishitanii]
MNKLLVIYPKEFKSYSKFARKLKNIVSNFGVYTIISPLDYNGFVSQFSSEGGNVASFEIAKEWKLSQFTHAIVFDDGEEFISEIEFIKAVSLPIRVIKIKITRVINIKNSDEYSTTTIDPKFEYIGRGSYWGNPYSIYEVEDLDEDETPRDNVIRKFKYDFEYNCLLNRDKNKVYSLAGKRLGCYCKPEACHGDVLADYLNSYDDGE